MSERGTFRKYRDVRLGAAALATIDTANAIINEYEAKGYSLTLRQLYYQFVARGLVPNEQRSYVKLGNVVSDGRLAGLVSWTAIEDRTRNLMGLPTHASPRQALEGAARAFRRDLWADQPVRPEVWVEKEALVGVIQRIANEHRVDFFACRGYNSQSEQYRAGRRFADRVRRGQRTVVLHLGDHDPSGIDMTRDNRDRLEMFAGVPVQVVRLALNMPQVEELRPPPNPAKSTDSRFVEYQARYGSESWELDALDPAYISSLVGDAVNRMRDPVRWDAALGREAQEQQYIQDLLDDL